MAQAAPNDDDGVLRKTAGIDAQNHSGPRVEGEASNAPRLFRGDLMRCRASISTPQAFKGVGAGPGEDHPHIAVGAVRSVTFDRLESGFPGHSFGPRFE